MIIIIPEKAFIKNAKKLVEPKNYFIFDATDDSSAKLQRYTNVIAVDALAPPSKLIEARKKEDVLDERKLEKLEYNYLHGDNLEAGIMAVIKSIIEFTGTSNPEDINIFLVMSKGGYKFYAKKLAKRMQKLYDIDFDLVVLWKDIKDDFKSVIRKNLGSKKMGKLADKHNELIKKLNKKKRKKKKK